MPRYLARSKHADEQKRNFQFLDIQDFLEPARLGLQGRRGRHKGGGGNPRCYSLNRSRSPGVKNFYVPVWNQAGAAQEDAGKVIGGRRTSESCWQDRPSRPPPDSYRFPGSQQGICPRSPRPWPGLQSWTCGIGAERPRHVWQIAPPPEPPKEEQNLHLWRCKPHVVPGSGKAPHTNCAL